MRHSPPNMAVVMVSLSPLVEESMRGISRIQHVAECQVRIDEDWKEKVLDAWVRALKLPRNSVKSSLLGKGIRVLMVLDTSGLFAVAI